MLSRNVGAVGAVSAVDAAATEAAVRTARRRRVARILGGAWLLAAAATSGAPVFLGPHITLVKTFANSRYSPGDQFTVFILHGTTVIANSTSAGAGATVTAGTGVVNSIAVTAGVAYTLGEAPATASALLANYQTSILCTNAATSSATVLPAGPVSTTPTITPTAGDAITCQLINTALPPPFSGCDAHAFMVFGPTGSHSGLLALDLATGLSTVVSPDIGFEVNAIGYNALDNRIYGVEIAGPGNNLIAIGAGGAAARIGPLPPPALTGYVVGDVDAAGFLNATSNPGTSVAVVNVNPGPNFLKTVLPYPNPFLAANLGDDWSFDATSTLYTAVSQGANNITVYKSGPPIPVATGVAQPGDVVFGSTFEDGANGFYAVANASGNVYRMSGGVISLVGVIPQIAAIPPPKNVDAARCQQAPPPCACTTAGNLALTCVRQVCGAPPTWDYAFTASETLSGAANCTLSLTAGTSGVTVTSYSPTVLVAGANSIQGQLTAPSSAGAVNLVLQCTNGTTTLCLENLGAALPACQVNPNPNARP